MQSNLTPFLTDEMQPRLPKQLTTMQQAEEEEDQPILHADNLKGNTE
jgi:hypothetical protein